MSATLAPPAAPPSQRTTPPRWAAALSGLLATAMALAVGELVAGALTAPSPVVVIGDRVIDLVPPPVKDFGIAVFGTNDKLALVIGIVALSAVLGAGLGLVAVRRFHVASAGFALFGALGISAALGDARFSPLQAALPSAAAAFAGIGALAVLVRRLEARPNAGGVGGRNAMAAEGRALDRRAFLRTSALIGGLVVAAAGTGRWLQSRATAVASRAAVVLPRPRSPLPPVPEGASLDIEGLAPYITPNADFYRIDTALRVPQVDPSTWRLAITGMVDRPFELSFDDLLDRPMIEAGVTLACVSNEVGGNLVGNARWLGVRLVELLEEAGVQPGATQLVGRSVDGFTVGFPTEVALNSPEAMVAVGMNGEPLPVEHGFPARLVVPGLYGYVSATKWLAEIELTTLEAFDAYWIPRGWAKEAPIKTQSRIDVPGGLATIPPGRTPIAGVAWAPTRGIERVDVRIDDAPWTEARLAAGVDVDTWRQWVLEWDATPGQHVLSVRATDGTGETQTEERTRPAPDGASGWHTVRVRVTDA